MDEINVTISPPSIQDWSVENPGLHMFYVKTAVKHLMEIDLSIAKFESLSNLNMGDIIAALLTERNNLVTRNKAYADANEIIEDYIPRRAKAQCLR